MRLARLLAAIVVIVAGLMSGVRGQGQSRALFDEQLLEAFAYRNIGPFRMQVRIADIAVPASPVKEHLYTIYVAPWIGGLWKTTNNGTTWDPVFDGQSTGSIGHVTVDPSNANIVYVAAMGHLHSENAERGVFRTTNGGQSWETVLFVNERVGVIDLVMNPRNPSVLYAATYDVKRLPWQIVNGGPDSGVHKTSDGGKTWTKLAGGFPTGKIGRIGIDIYARNPDILYAIVENSNTRVGAPAAGTTTRTSSSPALQVGSRRTPARPGAGSSPGCSETSGRSGSIPTILTA